MATMAVVALTQTQKGWATPSWVRHNVKNGSGTVGAIRVKMDPLATWTLLVVVFFACFATQQPALRQMGLTAETLFSGWIGSMKNEFVASQCRRTLAVAWCHAGLAAGYGLGVLYLVFVLVPEHGTAQEWSHEWRSVVVAAAVAIIVAAGGVAGYLYYVSKDLRRHWIFRRVAAQDPANPVRLINAIDAEVRSNFDDISRTRIISGQFPYFILIFKDSGWVPSALHHHLVDPQVDHVQHRVGSPARCRSFVRVLKNIIFLIIIFLN